MKKTISLLLALILCMSLLPVAASAYSTGKVDEANALCLGGYLTGNAAYIDKNNTLWMRGDNASGQLLHDGKGDAENSLGYFIQSTFLPIMEDVASVCVHNATAVIKTDGSLWMWGSNFGKIPGQSEDKVLKPVKVMDQVAAVSIGDAFVAAIKTDGSLWMWGNSMPSELGINTTGDSSVPVKVMERVKAVVCGLSQVGVVKTDGSFWVWEMDTAPVHVMDGVTSVFYNYRAFAAIKEDNSLWIWGDSIFSFLSIPESICKTITDQSVPIKVMDKVSAFAMGFVGSLAIREDHSLWAWGCNTNGELLGMNRLGDGNRCLDPVKIADDVVQVAAGHDHAAFVKTDGSLWMWGMNNNSQLPFTSVNDTFTNQYIEQPVQSVPRQVEGATVRTGEAEIKYPELTTGFGNFSKQNTYTDGMFTDVPANQWYADTVKAAYELGLAKGSSETTFSPGGNVTIAETLAFACRVHSIYSTGKADFKQGGVWYQVYVDYAIANDIIKEGEYTNYTAKANRAQFASILAKALPADALDAINNISILPDVNKSSAYGEAVFTLYNAGVLTGSDTKGTFNPASSISRGEVATIIARMAIPSLRKTITLDN